jgi:glycosyltransferase involved in cell wall biosynthesis
MKLLCVIDHLGSGGAQRQMALLCRGLAEKGHEVDLFVYYPEHMFFITHVQVLGVRILVHERKEGVWRIVRALSGYMKREEYDAVLSFLQTPNFLTELAALIGRPRRLIVSERNSVRNDRAMPYALAQRAMHVRANVVVANTHSHAAWLRRWPWLRRKIRVVYNGAHVGRFTQITAPASIAEARLVGIGRICRQKNPIGLIEALGNLIARFGECPEVFWAGRRECSEAGVRYGNEVDKALANHPEVAARWSWLGEVECVGELLRAHHALILPSLWEGLPNVVCEAFAAGRPVLVSNVCDNALLADQPRRGFVFDPTSKDEMADAILALCLQSNAEWEEMGVEAYRFAHDNLAKERMVKEYERLMLGE